jgi:adenylate cyclase
MSRFEWEKRYLLKKPKTATLWKGVIDKIRFEVKIGNHTYEVDEFYGANEGLTVAEIELESESETFTKPNWLGIGWQMTIGITIQT